MEGTRINKYLSESGVCSRREADRQIEAGAVTIDGRVAQMGDRVEAGMQVCFRGRLVEPEEEMVLIVLNKPKGIVCTAEKREKDNVVDFVNYKSRIYPIGRLDKDSSGLLLMTNNGEIVNKIMRAGNMHEKEYIVTVNRPITDAFLKGMANGVPILDTITRECVVEKLDKRKFRIILTQGLNRQIRRMCEYFGFRVVRLERVRIMNIELGNLPSGSYREVTKEELEQLYAMIRESSNETVILSEEQKQQARQRVQQQRQQGQNDRGKRTRQWESRRSDDRQPAKQSASAMNERKRSEYKGGRRNDRRTDRRTDRREDSTRAGGRTWKRSERE